MTQLKNKKKKKLRKTNSLIFQSFFENGKFQNSFEKIKKIGTQHESILFKTQHKLEGFPYVVQRYVIKIDQETEMRKMPLFKRVNEIVQLNND